MKKKPFYFEIKTAVTQFMAAFNDIFIKRYDKDRNVTATDIPVGFVYGPKQRVIEDILNKSKTVILPVVSVSVISVQRDGERVFNKIQGHYINTSPGEDKVRMIPQPIPISLGVKLSIIARYQEDIEQIMSNISVYCDPYITVSWKLPTTENTSYSQEIRSIVEWGGTFELNFPAELSSNQTARITADTSFNIKTWLFKEIDTATGIIHKIDTSFMPSLITGECFLFNDSTDQAIYINSGDLSAKNIITTTGIPYIKDCSITAFSKTKNLIDNTPITLFGDNFNRIEGLYILPMASMWLPESPLFSNMIEYDLYSNTKQSIRDNFPAFTGRLVTKYNVQSDNKIVFYMPTPPLISNEYFDILAASESGYSRLSIDSEKKSITSDFNWQPPYFNTGIKVT